MPFNLKADRQSVIITPAADRSKASVCGVRKYGTISLVALPLELFFCDLILRFMIESEMRPHWAAFS